MKNIDISFQNRKDIAEKDFNSDLHWTRILTKFSKSPAIVVEEQITKY